MQRVMMESGIRWYCLKIKVNAEFLSLDLLFVFSLKKSTGNSQGLIRLSNNSVSRLIIQLMYKERKQIMSKSLDSIRYLHLHDALPPDFPVEIRKYQTSYGNINMKAHWRGFMGILTPKAVFPLKSYRLAQQVCKSNYHAIVAILP